MNGIRQQHVHSSKVYGNSLIDVNYFNTVCSQFFKESPARRQPVTITSKSTCLLKSVFDMKNSKRYRYVKENKIDIDLCVHKQHREHVL